MPSMVNRAHVFLRLSRRLRGQTRPRLSTPALDVLWVAERYVK